MVNLIRKRRSFRPGGKRYQRGVEVGIVWAFMRTEPRPVEVPLRTDLVPLVTRLANTLARFVEDIGVHDCRAFGCDADEVSVHVFGDWVDVVIT